MKEETRDYRAAKSTNRFFYYIFVRSIAGNLRPSSSYSTYEFRSGFRLSPLSSPWLGEREKRSRNENRLVARLNRPKGSDDSPFPWRVSPFPIITFDVNNNGVVHTRTEDPPRTYRRLFHRPSVSLFPLRTVDAPGIINNTRTVLVRHAALIKR